MNEILFLRFFTALATTNADDPDIHAANDYAISLVKSNRAALTRAEAAEALAYERLEDALFAEQRATDAEMERDELAARVAELEAERAAQQWRPVTADWPPCNRQVVISAPGASWADVARKQHDGEEYVWQLKNGHVLDFESATVATPLPPAPAPQEPTP